MFKSYRSDVKSHYGTLSLLIYLKSVLNPSIHACLLVRCAAKTSGFFHVLIRNILIMKHSIDVGSGAVIGYGLNLPHPVNIVIGSGVVIGEGVTIYHGVTLGNKLGYPRIDSDVTIYTNATIVGPIVVGRASVVGANKFIDKDFQAESIIK